MPNRFTPSGQTWTLPELLETYRKKAGYTIEQAAKLLSMPVEQYRKFESGDAVIDIFFIETLIAVFKLPKISKKIAYDPRKPAYCYQIAKLRIKAGLTQEAVAHQLGIALQTYAGYESGRREPDIDKLIRLAKLYDTSVDILIGNGVALREIAHFYTQREEEYTDEAEEIAEYKQRPMVDTKKWDDK